MSVPSPKYWLAAAPKLILPSTGELVKVFVDSNLVPPSDSRPPETVTLDAPPPEEAQEVVVQPEPRAVPLKPSAKVGASSTPPLATDTAVPLLVPLAKSAGVCRQVPTPVVNVQVLSAPSGLPAASVTVPDTVTW